MDVNSIKCIEFHQGKLRLGLCNDDQKPRHQKWKFEAYNPNLINSKEHPSLIPSRILEWHKNYSIHDMPFPTMPPIVQNRNNISLDEDETIAETTPVPDTTPETTKKEDPEILEIKAVETPILNETKVAAASQIKQQKLENNQNKNLTTTFSGGIARPAEGINTNSSNLPTMDPTRPTDPSVPAPTKTTTTTTTTTSTTTSTSKPIPIPEPTKPPIPHPRNSSQSNTQPFT
jgi:hypothetical protein